MQAINQQSRRERLAAYRRTRRAREFRAQMERAKENARSRGEAEAKRILADAKSAADAAFRELDELRKAQKKQLDAQAMNEKRVEIVSELNAARERAGVRDESREPIPAPSRPIRAGGAPHRGRRARRHEKNDRARVAEPPHPQYSCGRTRAGPARHGNA